MRAATRRGSEAFEVTVAPLGGVRKTVTLEDGARVSDALEAAGLAAGSNTEVRVNGETVQMRDYVEAGDILIVMSASKIEGGQA